MKKGRKKLVKAIATQIAMEFMAQTRAPRRKPVRRGAPAAKASPAAVAAAPPPRQPIKITDQMLEQSKQKRRRFPRLNPFALPQFPVAVTDHIPAERRMAADEAIGSAAAWAGGAWGALGAQAAFEGITFLGYPYLAELAQRPEYRVIVETIATEMTRKWIKVQAKGDVDKTKQIGELNDELDRLKVRDVFCKAAEVDGYFGRAHLYIDTGDTDDRKELMTPIGDGSNKISEKKLSKNDIKRLAVVEPIWTYPANYNSNNPLKPDWYRPQSWFVMGTEMHASRLLPFVGREVPDILKPAYSFGGLSLSQMAKPYVENWLNTRQSVADIVQAFSVMVLKTSLSETLTPGGQGLFGRAEMFNNYRDNSGIMIVDKDMEDFENVSAPLGTLDVLQAQTQEHMAAVSRIPLVKLLGIQPAGLNASSEGEFRAFYDSIHAAQEKFFSPNLNRIFAFAQINIWGKVDPDLTYAYEPLWSLDEKGEAEVRKIEAETDTILVDGGILRPEESRKRISADADSPYAGLDPDDLPDLLDEEEEGLEPKGSAEKLAQAAEGSKSDDSEASSESSPG